MSPTRKSINFRGVKEALIVEVLEGEGTTDSPYAVVEYVVVDGVLIGKVEALSKYV